MKKIMLTIALAATVLLPAFAQARDVTFTTQLKNYGGDGAYLAIYLVKADGQYQQTLWIAGKKAKYYKSLSGWASGSGQQSSEYDGRTGASLSSGRSLKITVDLDDQFFDSGYEVRVDTAVEDMRENRADVTVALTTNDAGKSFSGRGYVKSFSYSF